MKHILESYYEGILGQIKSEVDFINTIFNHQGEKGRGNENILRDLISRFLPKKYGVGTGIIIDSEGNQSKQIDIIIYDIEIYPSLLSLTSLHLFPIDMVYATIEVKTTLNKKTVKESLENIKSTKELKILKDDFCVPENDRISQSYKYNFIENVHPLGVIFSYKSANKKIESYINWFKDISKNHAPNLICSIDKGVLYYSSSINNTNGNIKCAMYVEQTNKTKGPEISHNSQLKSVNQSKNLLNFLLLLDRGLRNKKLIPNIDILEEYLSFLQKEMIIIND